MKFIIDGYNLMGSIEEISLSSSSKEDQLMAFLQLFTDRHSFLIVFDGKNKNYPYGQKITQKKMTCVFTDIEDSADAYMLRKAQKMTNASTIFVSSDRELIRQIKRSGKKRLSSDAFLTLLSKEKRKNHIKKPHPSKMDTHYWLGTFGVSE
jgi:predicted RNA-binding protein with PIN domain